MTIREYNNGMNEFFKTHLTLTKLLVVLFGFIMFFGGLATHAFYQNHNKVEIKITNKGYQDLDLDTLLRVLVEGAYMEGQVDALDNNIKVKYSAEYDDYIWIDSCWDYTDIDDENAYIFLSRQDYGVAGEEDE